MNVMEFNAIASGVKQVEENWGGIDILVNNAGVFNMASIDKVTVGWSSSATITPPRGSPATIAPRASSPTSAANRRPAWRRSRNRVMN